MDPASRPTVIAAPGVDPIDPHYQRKNMFGIITTSRSSPATRRHTGLDRKTLFPRMDGTGPEDLDVLTATSPGIRQSAGDPSPELRIFRPKSRRSRKADIARAHRLLAADLTYVAHPSFDNPAARDAILAPASGFEGPERDRIPACADPNGGPSQEDRFPNREREAHAFRKLNYLKFLACRIRDGIDPDSPAPGELDEVERLQAAALKLKNRIVETHLPLAVSVAQKRFRPGYDLSDRISDAAFALMRAVDRFDFARGNRFNTYATWAVINELLHCDRKQRRRSNQVVAMQEAYLATKESDSERYEREEAQDVCRAAVERLLNRLDWRERRILECRHGIGGIAEHTLKQIGQDFGISKERVRQIVQRAHAKLRSFARLEAIDLLEL
jgi:RNA polymerase primary sigma factor